ncbi:MAG TPA: Zn-ribbon domain-containing OB-fold protein [Dehalococcoidia bacterium]|nr:Zn-ribbon domain-containing OB-fold protein [Dehalococcoidia bacterium]
MEYKLTYKEYREALKQNKLLGLKCQNCGSVTVPPKLVCRSCASMDLEVLELKGAGKIQTFTTCNVASEGRESEVPYTILLVELDEGPWLMGNLTGVDPEKATMETLIGKRVKMTETRIFPGDKYSAGEGASPTFVLEA